MKKTPHSKNLSYRIRATGAFTLIETLLSASLGTFILSGVMTTYIGSMKGLQTISNYVEIHQNGRHAVDVFGRDMQAVSGISSCSTSGAMVVTIPISFTWNGIVTATKTITYSSSGNGWYRHDSQTGGTHMIANNAYQVVLTLFDRIGNPTTIPSIAKCVQVDLRLRKYVMSQVQSEDYVSARVIMRNKP